MRAVFDRLYDLIGYLAICIHKLLKYRTFRVFDEINIETDTLCNRKCKYCPNAYFERKREQMPEGLFRKIINELAAIKFGGCIFLHFFNEPLINKRLIDFIKYIRTKGLKGPIRIDTNGDLLNIDLFHTMIDAGVNYILVTQYDGKIDDHITEMMNRLSPKEKESLWNHAKVAIQQHRLVPKYSGWLR